MDETKQKSEYKIALLKRVAYITGAFALMVMLLMIINFVQLKTTDPTQLQSLNLLLTQYDADSKNELLKEEIRSLDLMARQVLFTKTWQLKAGAYLLLIFVCVSLICFRIIHSLKFRLEVPTSTPPKSDWQIKTEVRGAMLYVGVFLVGLLIVIYYFSDKEFAKYLATGQTPALAEGQNTNTEAENTALPALPDSLPAFSDTTNEQTLAGKITPETNNTALTAILETPQSEMAKISTDSLKLNHIGFRGYRSLGVSYNTNIPVEWDGKTGKNIKWKTPVPRSGFSSPIIWGHLLFITGADNVAREVYCYNRFTGKNVWTVLVNNIPGSPATTPKVTDDTGLAAPTMTTDGKYVFAIFGTGDLICLDMKGKKIWAKNLGVPDNHYGHSSSLLTHEGLLYVQYDDNKAARLLAFDTQTGAEKFRTPRTSKISWTSPILIQRGQQTEIIIASDPGVAAYNARTGKESWKVNCLNGEIGASAAYNGKYIFAGNEYAKLVAIEPGNNAKIVWEAYDYLPEVASPVVNNKIVITATSYGGIACFDANTGDILWKQEFPNGFYASPIIAEGKVYLTDMQGDMYIFKESENFALIAKPALGEAVVSTPAFANGHIYIRGNKNLYCISSLK